jgi:hypothetical protein
VSTNSGLKNRLGLGKLPYPCEHEDVFLI